MHNIHAIRIATRRAHAIWRAAQAAAHSLYRRRGDGTLFEQLEGRRLFAVSVGLNGVGELEVIGDANNNTIRLDNVGDGNDIAVYVGGTLDSTYNNVPYMRLYGGSGDDTLTVDSDVTVDSQIWLQDGNDTLYGGGGDDYVSDGAGTDIVYAGGGNDTLAGAEGNDSLFGEAGDDRIECNADNEADYVSGGDGSDVGIYDALDSDDGTVETYL